MNTPGSVDWTPADLKRKLLKLLPLLALFVRASIGVAMLNGGLIGIFSKNNGANVFNNPGLRGAMAPAGLESLSTIIPYIELALGVGLIFGIFTTISALLACAFSLVGQLITTITLITNAGIGPGIDPLTMGLNPLTMFYPNQGVVAYTLLVALSPLSVNRFSIDALIFQKEITSPPEHGVDFVTKEEIDAR